LITFRIDNEDRTESPPSLTKEETESWSRIWRPRPVPRVRWEEMNNHLTTKKKEKGNNNTVQSDSGWGGWVDRLVILTRKRLRSRGANLNLIVSFPISSHIHKQFSLTQMYFIFFQISSNGWIVLVFTFKTGTNQYKCLNCGRRISRAVILVLPTWSCLPLSRCQLKITQFFLFPMKSVINLVQTRDSNYR